MKHFDYENVADEADVPRDKLKEICKYARKDHLDDDLQYELHVLRVMIAIRDGHTSLEKIEKEMYEDQKC